MEKEFPSYLHAHDTRKLQEVAQKAWEMLSSCTLCPRRCKVNRLNKKIGFCKTGTEAKVYSYLAHSGEEPPISGTFGSGTIFFSGCTMSCLYCQNHKFSQSNEGKEVTTERLADMMIELQHASCHNINLVTPTHVLPHILKALILAIEKGLHIPLVYNTSGYELAETIKLLDGIVDIYLADMRYADDEQAIKYSHAPGYANCNRESIKEMYRQVGMVSLNDKEIIQRGIIIRHLVLPENISGTKSIMEFIAQEISKETYVSLMSQYKPYYKAESYKPLSRRIHVEEYELAQTIMEECGLANGWVQEAGGLESFAGVHIKPKE